MASSTTATYYSSPPMTMDYSFATPTTATATATTYSPSSYTSQHPPAMNTTTTALVPATAPGATIYYNNYTLPSNTGDEDLLDLSGASTSSSSYYTSPPPPSVDDLLSFDDNISTAAASNRDRTRNTVDEAVNLQALQDRDDAFVNNLPRELIEEQQRILAHIQRGNTSSSSSSTTNDRQLVAFNTIGHERYQQRFAAMPNMNGNGGELSVSTTTHHTLPAEVHPRKYQMKTERKVKTATAATAGAIIGGLILAPVWPLGAMAGAAAGGYAGKVVARSGERKQQRKWEHKNFNDYTNAGHCDVQSTTVAFA